MSYDDFVFTWIPCVINITLCEMGDGIFISFKLLMSCPDFLLLPNVLILDNLDLIVMLWNNLLQLCYPLVPLFLHFLYTLFGEPFYQCSCSWFFRSDRNFDIGFHMSFFHFYQAWLGQVPSPVLVFIVLALK